MWLPQNIALAPRGTYDALAQQLPIVYSMSAVSIGVNMDSSGLVNAQFLRTTEKDFAPQVLGTLLTLAELAAPVVSQVHQEQVVAGQTTQNIVDISTVQEQVIAQEIPEFQVVEKM